VHPTCAFYALTHDDRDSEGSGDDEVRWEAGKIFLDAVSFEHDPTCGAAATLDIRVINNSKIVGKGMHVDIGPFRTPTFDVPASTFDHKGNQVNVGFHVVKMTIPNYLAQPDKMKAKLIDNPQQSTKTVMTDMGMYLYTNFKCTLGSKMQ
jgi:hypothetical protein